MSDIDEEIRREVIAEIYRQVDDLDWDGMTLRARAEWYVRCIDDPLIGGKLMRFIERDRVRVWVKDGPIKELPRARHGIGPYAQFAVSRYPGMEQIAHQAIGPDWLADPETVDVKPNRCLVHGPEARALMIWGPAAKLADLVWAAINARVDGGAEPLIVVTSPQGTRLSEGEKLRHRLLAKEAGIELRHITLRLTRV
ncbi:MULTISPECIES: hypothetical protein [Streptomyces]|uniref:hypothetical protein n=1 Tax=Streptomyces TaxID=1883 RepID=UPI00206F5147|nr:MULTISPECIES: hypothetical protein [Streptomyces]UPT43567.1 hypothetical protein MWG59_20465 [Streptomyces sp. WAC00303]WIY77753.1 hypothetical protein QPM16_20235 [Streptomyces anulatus]